MKIFKELKKLGYKHYTENTIEELDNLPLDSEERIMEQSLVLRWFRDKYKLCGLIEVGTQEFSYQVFNNKGDRQLGTEPISYNGTYEEAEVECLKKLIEIVKK